MEKRTKRFSTYPVLLWGFEYFLTITTKVFLQYVFLVIAWKHISYKGLAFSNW